MTKLCMSLIVALSLPILGYANPQGNPTRGSPSGAPNESAEGRPGNLENKINGGWYGWIGNHKITGMYDPEMDAEGMRRRHVNWYWLGKQWVVPFLVADMADVRQTMIEESRRARIWVELYWWGNHSTWEGFVGMGYPGLYEKLRQGGIPAGGDDLTGKDWFAVAEDPKVMQSVKKTIKWQLDTMARYVGTDTIYGVLLSEEEPDQGINVTVGQVGGRKYEENRELAQQKLIQVHNELYDYVKSLYPNLKISPGFYPRWVKPGTLKYDAVVMDNYPTPGKEEEKFEEWQRAYGTEKEQYVLLWGYGNLDYPLELARFEKVVKIHLDHGLKNLGFFAPALSLRDPIYRLFATRGVGSHAPYRLEEHRASVSALLTETRSTLAELAGFPELKLPAGSLGEPAQAASRQELCRMADQIYALRKEVLDQAYRQVQKVREWVDFAATLRLLRAEGWAPENALVDYPAISKQISEWETLSKEFRTLSRFYRAVLPMEASLGARAVKVADVMVSHEMKLPAIQPKLSAVAERLRAHSYAGAYRQAVEARDVLVQSRTERSWLMEIGLGNSYQYPLTVELMISADYGDGVRYEIYRGIPFETSGNSALNFTLLLPKRPARLILSTGPWSGDLRVEKLRVSNSRETLAPALVEEDHAKGVKEYLANANHPFVLSPWGSASHVVFKY